MATYIDLNCDMGESYGRWSLGDDEEIMPFITSANVGCGYHGGDPHVMRRTVALALRHGVAVGSHPSLPDLMGFGRRHMEVTPDELQDFVWYQTGALREFARAAGSDLQHIKPHGVLYNMLEDDEALAAAVARSTMATGGTDLILLCLASGKADRVSRALGARVASEGFADRGYDRDGRLTSRKLPGSLHTDPQKAADQAVRMVLEHKVRSVDGVDVDIHVESICCHGDTPGAPTIVRTVRAALEKAGILVKPLGEWLPKP